MNIKKIIVGFLKTNCYLIIKENDCLIVDPGADYELIKENIGDLKVKGILLTHRHPDHIGALNQLINDYKVDIYDNRMGEGTYSIDSFTFDIIENKGHTDDSITYYFKDENIMFVGDFIFKGTVGRTDLPSGSEDDMRNSLAKIKEYNHDIKIYSGHGSETVLGYEIEHNPYFKLASENR